MNYNIVDSEHFDVVVCGSGPAGIGAAIAAKKLGADVMVLEASNLLGGTINAVPWMPVNRLLLDKGKRSYPHDVFVRHLLKYGETAVRPGHEDVINGDGFSCHVEYSELAMYDMFEEQEIAYKMFSPVVDVIMDDDVLKGVITREKRGYISYYAKIVIDATGDGEVGSRSGCEIMEGSDEGIHMPITLGFSIGGVDKDTFFSWLEENREEYDRRLTDAHNKGYYVAAWYGFNPGTLPGIIGVNNGAWRGQSLKSNGLDSKDLTAARRNGLKVATDFVKVFKEYNMPGFENCFLDKVGNMLGVRDTRRIVGEYTQTYDDSQNSKDFEDTIAKKYGHIDGNQIYIGPMVSGFNFPYRSLVPVGVTNLLLAGRCASMTFIGHCAGKSMGNMMELGIAAGAAAALSISLKTTPRDLDIKKLQHSLQHDLEVIL